MSPSKLGFGLLAQLSSRAVCFPFRAALSLLCFAGFLRSAALLAPAAGFSAYDC